MVRASARSPTCQSPVPAELVLTRRPRPERVNKSRSTSSAMGERQMFPVHTKMIRKGVDSSGLSDTKLMLPLWSTFPALHSEPDEYCLLYTSDAADDLH